MHVLDPEHPDEVAALQALLESVPGYSQRVNGHPSTPGDAEEVLRALPPDLDPGRKVGLGLWDWEPPARLVAFADLLHGWPRPDVVHIGLLAVHGEHHGGGHGRRLHDEVVALARHWGDVGRLRLGIVASNAEIAEPFWRALGYRPTGEVTPYGSGTESSTAAIWERDPGPRPSQ